MIYEHNFGISTIVPGEHPYITSAKGLDWWVKKKARFADVQYCIYADKKNKNMLT